MPTPKRIPLGTPLDLSDETLDELTTAEAITPDELELAFLLALWRRLVPDDLTTLLEAQEINDVRI